MASSTSIPPAGPASELPQQNGLPLWPTITKLAGWRFKQMWRFLLVHWLGMLAMVVLICAGPLFVQVGNSASLQYLLKSAPEGPYILVDTVSDHPSQTQVQQIEQQTSQVLQHGVLGKYLRDKPQSIIQTPALDIITNGTTTTPSAFRIAGYDMTQASQHTNLIDGRLPQATTDDTVEIALSQDAATHLGLQVGSTIQGRYPIALGSQVWTLRVVGIIAAKAAGDTFWTLADPFSKAGIALNSRYYRVENGAPSYIALAANATISAKIAVLQSTTIGDMSSTGTTNLFVLFWRYPFDIAHLDPNDVPALSQQTTDVNQRFSGASVFGTIFTALGFRSSNVIDLQIEVTVLLLITLALVLFLVSTMSDLLIERQAEIIATIRSRGATRLQIFGAFTLQGIVVALLALLAGPFLAIFLVSFMARSLLTADQQGALTVVTAHPLQALLDVWGYALVAVAVALFVMIRAINSATKMDIVAMRRDASRPQRVSFWRRLNLDLFFSLLLLIIFAAFAYFWPAIMTAGDQIDYYVYNLFADSGIFVAPLLVAAVLLLFLRFSPRILRLSAALVARLRSAPAVLALAQIERRPRPAMRIIILLALAIASSSFLFTLIATKNQYNVDTANFFVEGADFSGPLSTTGPEPNNSATSPLAQLQAQYNGLSGVQSATLGYHDVIQLDTDQNVSGQGSLTINAVDADTYARTINWATTYSSQSATDLMTQLVSHRVDATSHNVVYALVDAAAWKRLNLSTGEQFSLPIDTNGPVHANFVALAPISYVPGLKDLSTFPSSGMGVIVDYQSYITVKANVTHITTSAFMPNYLWLKTRDDAASLAHIRSVLPNMNDRRSVLLEMQNDADHLGVIGVMALGVAAALLLALIGTLVSSWSSGVSRLTNFAVARALGMAPRQIAALLLWEQGFIYVLALLLGIVLSAMLMLFVPSTVSVLTNFHGHPWNDGTPNAPPVQIVIPYTQLLFSLGVFVLICLGALLLLARMVSRPSVSQTLRLNED